MKPAYVKWLAVIVLGALAFHFASELFGLGAVLTWCNIDDEDYR